LAYKKNKALKYKGRTYRSKFEVSIAKELTCLGIKFKYEHKSFSYLDPVPRAECSDCNSKDVFVRRSYTPDFFLENGIIIEAKGKLDFAARKKLKAIKASNPDLDLKILFMRDQKISKGSTTLYSEWAYQHGFDYQVTNVPKRWTTNGKD